MIGWLILGAALALGVPAAAYLAQDRMLFLPHLAVPSPSPGRAPRPVEEIVFETPDGPRLRGWLARGQVSLAPLLVYYGGNAENVVGQAFEPWPGDWSLALVNYRGYGESEGRPSEGALCADAELVFDALARRPDVDPARIVLVGRSLGTGVATYVAARRDVRGAVLISPYDSMVALARHHYPLLPVGLLLRHRFDSIARAPSIGTPLLAIVGERDPVIPLAHSRRLYDAWGGRKRWVALPGADHDTPGQEQEFWEEIRAFLEAVRAS